jgi:hypothetical protein
MSAERPRSRSEKNVDFKEAYQPPKPRSPLVDMINDVLEFTTTFGHIFEPAPKIPGQRIRELRHKLISDEWDEFTEAWENNDIPEMADAICDMIYVLIGTAFAYGIPLAHCWRMVQNSNMNKLWTLEEIKVGVWEADVIADGGSPRWAVGDAIVIRDKFVVGQSWIALPVGESKRGKCSDTFGTDPKKRCSREFVVYDPTGKVRKPPSWQGPNIAGLIDSYDSEYHYHTATQELISTFESQLEANAKALGMNPHDYSCWVYPFPVSQFSVGHDDINFSIPDTGYSGPALTFADLMMAPDRDTLEDLAEEMEYEEMNGPPTPFNRADDAASDYTADDDGLGDGKYDSDETDGACDLKVHDNGKHFHVSFPQLDPLTGGPLEETETVSITIGEAPIRNFHSLSDAELKLVNRYRATKAEFIRSTSCPIANSSCSVEEAHAEQAEPGNS